MSDIDAIVIGAGAVGLAVAAELARRGHDTIIIEKAQAIGTGISSRNSEVIHAGLYYPNGSLKHRFCVDGRRRLYAFAGSHGVAHRKTGKMIVATQAAEDAQLHALHRRGLENDVEGLRPLTAAEAIALEPALSCTSALMSEETGILDSHGYMLALKGELEDHGGAVAFNAPFLGASPLTGGGFDVRVGGNEPMSLKTRFLVNSASLFAHDVCARIEGLPPESLPPFTLAKGSYFSCAARSPFRHLIYPVPVNGGLGVHVTLDLGGALRFGPDVEWLGHGDPDAIDYTVESRRSEGFYAAIRTYWPGLPDASILPAYSGCRPKLSGPGEAAVDFHVAGAETHGLEGLVNLLGIESPGLTSSLAIADYVTDLLAE